MQRRFVTRLRQRKLVTGATASAVLALGAAIAFASLTGNRPSAARAALVPGVAASPIQHVVILLKENRSFDHYFGQFPGVDGATHGTTSDGQVVPLVPPQEPMPQDVSHEPYDWKVAYDGGQMDGFDKEHGAITKSGVDLPYTQMTQSQIPNYWAYASHYALGDRFFAAWKGASFGNNLFAVAGQSGQFSTDNGDRAPYSLPNVGFQRHVNPWGCDSAPDTLVRLIGPDGSLSTDFPCFTFQSMPNVLSAYGVPWSFYGAPGDHGFSHNSLDALTPVRDNPQLWSNVKPFAQFTTDVADGSLPAVSWLAPTENDHPPRTACNGENDTVRLVNSIMQSPYWSSTAIFIFWDEWGGFYDHVAPPQIDTVSYGFRVPFLVVSPYTKTGSSPGGGSVSHTLYSSPSLLKFIETNWSLPSLGARDATANDVADMFDFTAPTRPAWILKQRSCASLTPEEQRYLARRSDD